MNPASPAKMPKAWNTKRIKYSTMVKARIGWQGLRTEEFCDEGPYLVTGTDFHHGRVNWKTCYHVSEERYLEDPHIHLQEGDLLITKDGSIGKLAITEQMPTKATLNSGVFVTRPLKRDYLNKFLYYVLSSNVFTEFVRYRSSGTTISHLYQNVFVDFAFSVPVIERQQSIIDFLDYETSKIDGLIAKKQRLVEFLDEKRAALISRAVTQGLDPNVPMKDSGVEWLGRFPAHWNASRLKHLISYVTSGSRGWAEHYTDSGPIFLRIGNLSRSGIGLVLDDVQHVMPPRGTEGRRTAVQENDILISITAWIGAIGLVPNSFGETYVNQHLALCRPKAARTHPEWLAYALVAGKTQAQFQALLNGGTKDGLGLDDVKNLCIAVPPVYEQEQIALRLRIAAAATDNANSLTQLTINLLREYRSALITAAVTGQLDIREHEKKLEALVS